MFLQSGGARCEAGTCVSWFRGGLGAASDAAKDNDQCNPKVRAFHRFLTYTSRSRTFSNHHRAGVTHLLDTRPAADAMSHSPYGGVVRGTFSPEGPGAVHTTASQARGTARRMLRELSMTPRIRVDAHLATLTGFPSSTVIMRSTGCAPICCLTPLGQSISIFSTFVAEPSPKWTRWSELEP